MSTKSLTKWALAVSLCALALPVWAGDCRPVLKDGWIKLLPVPEPKMLAGYGTLWTPCRGEFPTIVSVGSKSFMDVSLHHTIIVDGVSKMREVGSLELSPHGRVKLEPGGLHLMLMGPSKPLKEGDKVAVTFKLKDGREVSAELTVRKTAP